MTTVVDRETGEVIEGRASQGEIIEAINALEVEAFRAESEPSDIRWEQAKRVAEALASGMSTRQIAAKWRRADGEPYSDSHVRWVVKAWQVFGAYLSTQRPRWNDAYNSDAVRGKVHVSNNSGNNEWYTPPEYIEAARIVMGDIDLDPASSDAANEVVKAEQHFTVVDDGLSRDWSGRVWLNPPYAQPLISDFSQKLADEYARGGVLEACVLVNNATETEWFATLVEHAKAVCFPQSRIRFWGPDNEKGAPLQGQAVLYLGENVDGFRDAFGGFGWIAEVR